MSLGAGVVACNVVKNDNFIGKLSFIIFKGKFIIFKEIGILSFIIILIIFKDFLLNCSMAPILFFSVKYGRALHFHGNKSITGTINSLI